MAEIGNVTVRVDAVITDEQYREAMGAVRAANERMDLLEAENAKLRELVRDAVAFLDDDGPCEHCGYDTECFEQNGINVAYEGGCLMLDLFVNRAHELRVEVDG